MKKLQAVIAIAIIFLSSCKKKDMDTANPGVNNDVVNMEDMKVPDNFDYATTRTVEVNVYLADMANQPFKGVKVQIYDQAVNATGARVLLTGMTDATGHLQTTLTLPTYLKEVVINPVYIGIPGDVTVPVTATGISYTYAGGAIKSPYVQRDYQNTATHADRKYTTAKFSKKLGSWNSSGVPNYLISNDNISSSFLANINASLPESRPVPSYHPDYLNDAYERNLNITELSDVFVTFVSEGAGYRNSLFYYVYNKNNPPSQPSDIDSFYIVFPNASFSGSGGGMASGNKVKIGRFGKDTVIGFALAADGYTNSNTVGTGVGFYYTNKAFNPESNTNLKQHTVLLYDQSTGRFLIGFEDLHRDQGSDDDFNDVVFYASANPVEAISNDDVLPIDQPVDTDGDGVNDPYDDYPNDNTKAYDNYYPGANTYATVAFEDLWPSTGDYDVNDIVLRYRYKTVSNASNKVLTMECKYYVTAKGGTLSSGFGVQFPFAPSVVSTVTGTSYTKNIISLASNGVESGHNKATVIFFDEATNVIHTHGGSFYNTVKGNPVATVDTNVVKITFTSPITTATLGDFPFNPFIFAGNRGTEVHLPGKVNTAKATTSLFGQSRDNTSPSNNRYYVTKTNLFFALSLPVEFKYPKEKASILSAYKYFDDWAQSGGASHTNWYLNTGDNMDSEYLY